MSRWSALALLLIAGSGLAAAGARAESTLFVKGSTLESGALDPVLVLPGGSALDVSAMIARYRLAGGDSGDLLRFDLAPGVSGPTKVAPGTALGASVGAGSWFAYDASLHAFTPTGDGTSLEIVGSHPLDRPGAILLRSDSVPGPVVVPEPGRACLFVAALASLTALRATRRRVIRPPLLTSRRPA